jgi:hypothetical protein
LENAGDPPTRRGLIDGARGLGTYDQAGLACKPVDVSLANRTTIPSTTCGYYLRVEDGKFVPFPKNGKPITGKLVGSPEALAAAKSGTGPTTTTAPPSS